MKNIHKIIALSFLLLATGCEDILSEDPRGALTGTTALNSVEGLEAALTGAYKPLTITWGTGFATAATVAVLMGSDDLTTHSGSNKQDFREFDQLQVTGLNGRITPIWSGCYKSIQGANNIINNYKNTAGDASKIKQIAGEAYFLRAFDYYWLTRLWGKVPLITTADFSSELLSVKNAEVKEIYTQIESDLNNAITMLADKKRDVGRSNKGAAKALLADVYLTMAGWPLKETAKYSEAAKLAKEVIDQKSTFGFDLVPDLATFYNNTVAGVATSEEVFTLHFCGSCQWFTANALYGSSAMPSDEGGWDDYFPELNFYNSFPEGLRKDLTFHTTFTKAGGVKISWQEGQTKHPYYAKFRYTGGLNTSSTNSSLNLLRYPHLLLIYAEAKARTGTPDAQAYEGLNLIRKRAGLPALSGLSNEEFIKAVINEKSWEFAGEYTRWFDLQRLEMIEQVNTGKNPGDLKPAPVLSKKIYYLPVPNKDVTVNPNIGN